MTAIPYGLLAFRAESQSTWPQPIVLEIFVVIAFVWLSGLNYRVQALPFGVLLAVMAVALVIEGHWQRNWHHWEGRVLSERPENWTGDLGLVRGANLARYRHGSDRSFPIRADGAFLAKADFTDANLHYDSSFRGADLRSAVFSRLEIGPRISFAKADLRGATFEHVRFSGHREMFDGAQLEWATIGLGNSGSLWFEKVKLDGAKFNSELNVFLNRASARRLRFERARWDMGSCSLSDLSESNLAYGSFRLFDFLSCNLTKADLSEANLEGASIWADLNSANLKGANLNSANLSLAVNLTQAQIDSANGNVQTRLPPGLRMPEHWRSRY
jgi:uncharacterized protein YjbI with pentapeptide repeats